MSVGTVFAALYAAHQVDDHWVQTQHQADTKSLPGWPGRIACLSHVATYSATAAVALVLVATATGSTLDPVRAAAGLALSAASHYLADRRAPLRLLADRLGSGRFYRVNAGGINGAYLLDQSWHVGWLFMAALVMTGAA